MKTFTEVTLHVEDRVAVLTLARPERRNPISGPELIGDLVAALEEVQSSRDVSVLILTAAGPVFSAGGDVKAMRDRAETFAGSPLEIARNYHEGVQRIPRAFDALDVPSIAAIQGPAIGAGCDLALFCDIRIASTAATFGEVFVNLGLIPGDGGAWYLPRLVGAQRAAELVFTGRTVGAAEALEMGLVWKVVEPGALMAEARALAAAIAARPPQALRIAKRLLRQAGRLELLDFLDASAAQQAMLHHTGDHREAVLALLEKREGTFTGG